MSENEINKVHVLIRRFLFEVDGVIGDKDKCQKWLMSFAKTLQFQDLCEEPNEYAMFLLTEAKAFNSAQKRKSQMKQVRRMLKEEGVTNPTKAQLEERWILMYGDEDESEETTADASTREGEDERYHRGNTGTLESSTSAKTLYEARQNQRGGEGSLRLGGHVTPSRTCRPPRDFEEVKDFIAQNGLDYDDARLWWERNYVERDGIDKDGKPIKNWKGALVNACKAEETKRRTA